MAARRFFVHRGHLEREVVGLFLNVSFGATGAPTIVRGLSFESVVRNSAGRYTITLADEYFRLLGITFTELAAAVSNKKWQLVSYDVKTKVLVIQCVGPTASGDTAAVAVDPASGDELFLALSVSNTSAPR
jgi:hypothetical protein